MHTPLSCLEVLSIEGQRATDKRVENDAQTPDVHLGPVVFLALEELGGGIRWGSAERVQLVTQSELVAEAKVGYFDVHVCIQQQVLGLQAEEIGKVGGKNVLTLRYGSMSANSLSCQFYLRRHRLVMRRKQKNILTSS